MCWNYWVQFLLSQVFFFNKKVFKHEVVKFRGNDRKFPQKDECLFFVFLIEILFKFKKKKKRDNKSFQRLQTKIIAYSHTKTLKKLTVWFYIFYHDSYWNEICLIWPFKLSFHSVNFFPQIIKGIFFFKLIFIYKILKSFKDCNTLN